VNQELSVMHHFEDSWKKRTNMIYSYKFLVGNRFNQNFSLYAGPSFNMQVSRVTTSNDYTWYSIWSPSAKGRQYRFWAGITVGMRLFKQKNLPLLDYEWNRGEWDW
jgi:hypothetical protein